MFRETKAIKLITRGNTIIYYRNVWEIVKNLYLLLYNLLNIRINYINMYDLFVWCGLVISRIDEWTTGSDKYIARWKRYLVMKQAICAKARNVLGWHIFKYETKRRIIDHVVRLTIVRGNYKITIYSITRLDSRRNALHCICNAVWSEASLVGEGRGRAIRFDRSARFESVVELCNIVGTTVIPDDSSVIFFFFFNFSLNRSNGILNLKWDCWTIYTYVAHLCRQ